VNIEDLTIGQAREITALFGTKCEANSTKIDNGMIGKYVVVRCHDAGVHAGVLKAYNGRECVLSEARRLWYWKSAKGGIGLSSVAVEGLHKDSKVDSPCDIHLTENCEIIKCSTAGESSIRGMEIYRG